MKDFIANLFKENNNQPVFLRLYTRYLQQLDDTVKGNGIEKSACFDFDLNGFKLRWNVEIVHIPSEFDKESVMLFTDSHLKSKESNLYHALLSMVSESTDFGGFRATLSVEWLSDTILQIKSLKTQKTWQIAYSTNTFSSIVNMKMTPTRQKAIIGFNFSNLLCRLAKVIGTKPKRRYGEKEDRQIQIYFEGSGGEVLTNAYYFFDKNTVAVSENHIESSNQNQEFISFVNQFNKHRKIPMILPLHENMFSFLYKSFKIKDLFLSPRIHYSEDEPTTFHYSRIAVIPQKKDTYGSITIYQEYPKSERDTFLSSESDGSTANKSSFIDPLLRDDVDKLGYVDYFEPQALFSISKEKEYSFLEKNRDTGYNIFSRLKENKLYIKKKVHPSKAKWELSKLFLLFESKNIRGYIKAPDDFNDLIPYELEKANRHYTNLLVDYTETRNTTVPFLVSFESLKWLNDIYIEDTKSYHVGCISKSKSGALCLSITQNAYGFSRIQDDYKNIYDYFDRDKLNTCRAYQTYHDTNTYILSQQQSPDFPTVEDAPSFSEEVFKRLIE